MTGDCGVTECETAFAQGLCLVPAIAHAEAACVHEHFPAKDVCAECLRLLQAGEMICGYCYGGEAGHVCVLRLVRVRKEDDEV
jgi:hypothetical protein